MAKEEKAKKAAKSDEPVGIVQLKGELLAKVKAHQEKVSAKLGCDVTLTAIARGLIKSGLAGVKA